MLIGRKLVSQCELSQIAYLLTQLAIFCCLDEPCPLNLEPPKWGKAFIARTNAEAYIREVARVQGYGLASKTSKAEAYKVNGVFGPKKTARVYFACSRGPAIESKATIRKTKTIKHNCEFEVSINYSRRTDLWTVSQNEKKKDQQAHNHPPVTAPNELAYNRRFTPEVSQTISNMHAHGTAPKQIKALLNVRPGSEPKLRDIYNVNAHSRITMLKGRTPFEGLVDELRHSDWPSREEVAADGTVKSLCFS